MAINFILLLGKTIFIQIAGVLGIFFLFGFLLSKLQEWTQRNYARSVGWKGILWTAWFGTPIHELGHVFFAKIFRHRINRVSLFQPNAETGGLGHVEHSYKKYSLYQRIGNFFVGAGPMIFGSIILIAMLYFLLPNGRDVFVPLTKTQMSPINIIDSLKQTLANLFAPENLKAWNFWVFIYLSFCIASHIAPSKPDRNQMWRGFFWVVLILLIANAVALLIKKDITQYVLKLNQYLGIFTGIFIYTAIISLLHFILSSILLGPFKRR